MRNYFILAALASLLAACNSSSGPAAPAAQTATPQFHTEIPIKDIMDSVVDPSSDYVWESVSSSYSRKGLIEKVPKTDDEWKDVRRRVVALIEASNMLKIPGRLVAAPGTKSENPGIEESPEEMQKLIAEDPQNWIKGTEGLHSAAMELLKAADAKNPEGILDAGNTLDEACESCHLKYWYPKQTELLKQAAEELKNNAKSEGAVPDEHKGSVRKRAEGKK